MKLYSITILAGISILFAGCAKEIIESPAVSAEDGFVITAKAIAPGANIKTKVDYTDPYSEVEDQADITAGAWSVGDKFTALEINGDVVTAVTFTTSGSGASAEFKSSGAVEANENTAWIAVSGNATVENNLLVCSYEGQNGTLANLGNYDYAVAQSTGTTPSFDFSAGKRLTYVMRLLLPADIQYIEFNTGKDRNGGWNITSAAKAQGTISCTEKEAVHMITLPAVSTAKQAVYLAVPAIDLMHSSENRLAGLIITILSPDQKFSQGKTISSNLSAKGGHAGTYDMSNLELMPRPLPSEAVNLGSVTYGGKTYPLGNWAPFVVGGDFPGDDDAIKGNLYSWAETEPKTSFTDANYRWKNANNYDTGRGYKQIGAMEGVDPFIEVHYAGNKGFQCGPGTFYDIGGTKYDVARVKWGSAWRMPSNEICCNLLKDTDYRLTNEIDVDNKVTYSEYEPGTYTNFLGYRSSNLGCVVFEANGKRLEFYRSPYTDNGNLDNSGREGRYWMSCTDYGNRFYTSTPDSESGNYWNRACQLRLIYPNSSGLSENYVNNKSWVWDGLRVRAVLAE